LVDLLAGDPELRRWVDESTIRRLMSQPERHVGDAPHRARAMAYRARAVASLL
jgi:hypothetical protein